MKFDECDYDAVNLLLRLERRDPDGVRMVQDICDFTVKCDRGGGHDLARIRESTATQLNRGDASRYARLAADALTSDDDRRAADQVVNTCREWYMAELSGALPWRCQAWYEVTQRPMGDSLRVLTTALRVGVMGSVLAARRLRWRISP